jgi:L-malate glycosyltransferase
VVVVFLIDRLVTGGAQTQLMTLLAGLDRSEWTPHVVCFEAGAAHAARLRELDIPLHVFPRRWKLDTGVIRAIRRLFPRDKPALCHAWLQAGNLYGLLATWGLPRVRLLLSVRATAFGPREETAGSALWRGLSFRLHALARRLAVRRGAHVLTNATAIREELAGEGLSPEAVTVIPNGLPLPDLPERREPVVGAPLTIVSVFRLVPRKGGDVLLRALACLPRMRLLLVGGGHQREELEQLAAELGIADRVEFAGEQSDIRPWLARGDIFCLPSLRGEGVSNALLEAMGAGLPCVATDSGGTPEVLQDRVNGLLVPPGDPRVLASAMVHMFLDVAGRERMGRAARETMERDFGEERMVRETAALYRRICNI